MVAVILQAAVKAAQVEDPVDGMVMRHSYAVHCLETGLSIRQLQERLGHRRVTTTMIYLRLLHPNVVSPLDRLHAKRPTTFHRPPPGTINHPPSTIPDPQPPIPNEPSASVLFPTPLTTEGLALPFAGESGGLVVSARAFYGRLRTRVAGRFLALRRAIRSTA